MIILEGPEYRLERGMNGFTMTLTHKASGLSVFVQGEDATRMNSELEKRDDVRFLDSADQLLGYLWNDCEYGLVAC